MAQEEEAEHPADSWAPSDEEDAGAWVGASGVTMSAVEFEAAMEQLHRPTLPEEHLTREPSEPLHEATTMTDEPAFFPAELADPAFGEEGHLPAPHAREERDDATDRSNQGDSEQNPSTSSLSDNEQPTSMDDVNL